MIWRCLEGIAAVVRILCVAEGGRGWKGNGEGEEAGKRRLSWPCAPGQRPAQRCIRLLIPAAPNKYIGVHLELKVETNGLKLGLVLFEAVKN